MTRHRDDHGYESEPTFNDRPARGDPTESHTDRLLDKAKRSSRRAEEDAALHSVFNEPNIFPDRPAEEITADWYCLHCGYNLRGLMTDRPCPECGKTPLYRPPPEGQTSYGAWYRRRAAETTSVRSFFFLAAAAIVGGPWAVIGAIFNNAPSVLTAVVFGPTVEEVMKLAMIAMLIEVRPFLIKSANQIFVAAVLSALGFAVIENLIYLNVYIAAPSMALFLWRWIVCTGLHVTCTAIAARGLMRVWRDADAQPRAPRLSDAFPALIMAIVVHGVYNGFAVFADAVGYSF